MKASAFALMSVYSFLSQAICACTATACSGYVMIALQAIPSPSTPLRFSNILFLFFFFSFLFLFLFFSSLMPLFAGDWSRHWAGLHGLQRRSHQNSNGDTFFSFSSCLAWQHCSFFLNVSILTQFPTYFHSIPTPTHPAFAPALTLLSYCLCPATVSPSFICFISFPAFVQCMLKLLTWLLSLCIC